MTTKCTCCGQTIKAKRAPVPLDTTAMTDNQLHAYYKRIAPAEDIAFMLATVTLSPALRRDFEALQADVPHLTCAEIYRRYVILQDHWRVESNAVQATTAIEVAA